MPAVKREVERRQRPKRTWGPNSLIARLKQIDTTIHRCRAGWLTIVIGLGVAGATVHFWNAVFCLFFFFVGSGAWMVEKAKK